MSKAILEFDLSDSDGRDSFARCVLADSMAGLLWSFKYEFLRGIRRDLECDNTRYNSVDDVLDSIHEYLYDEMVERGINLDEIYK